MDWLKIDNLYYQSEDKEFNLYIPSLNLSSDTILINGSNGIGKTTLFKLFLNTLKQKSGTIYISQKLKNIVHIDQNLSLIDYLNIKENCKLQFSIMKKQIDSNLFLKKFDQLILDLNLKKVQQLPIFKLSMGQKQRALILKTLITCPDLILADEPTSFQDSSMKQNVINLLISFAKKEESKLLMVSHDHEIKSHFETVINFDQLINNKKDVAHDINLSKKTITS